MSKFCYNRTGNEVNMVATGSMLDIVAEIGYIVHRLHSGIKQQSEEAAKQFRSALVMALADPTSGIWDDAEKRPGEILIAQIQETPNK